MQLALDYSPWLNDRFRWSDETAFLDGGMPAGLHSIDAGALPLDLLVVNPDLLPQQHVLPVFFSAAINLREGRPGPFFSGAGVAQSLGVAALCVSDPSLAIDGGLVLSWYAGSQWQNTPLLLRRLLAGVSERLGMELLLIGGSGAGFSALHLGGQLGRRASVLVWNPQTDFLKYYRPAVDAFFEHCFPEDRPAPERLLERSRRLRERGLNHSVLDDYAAGSRPRRMLYLQNASDTFHLKRHAMPYVTATGMRPTGHGAYLAPNTDGALWLGAWGDGHDPIPKPLLLALIERMLIPGASASACLRWLENQQQAAFEPGAESEQGTLRTQVHQVEEGRLHAICSWVGTRGDFDEYAFYLMAGKKRIQTRWYEAAPDAYFDVNSRQAPTHVVGFARSKAGNKLHATAVIPSVFRVFVLGSCVSRDAFGLDSHSLSLAKYVARSSLATAFAGSAAPAYLHRVAKSLESKWQRQMVQIDLDKQVPQLLKDVQFDVLLLDLIDERFAISLFDGVPLTVSSEFARGYGSLDGIELLNAADARRMSLWLRGAEALVRQVGRDRIILNRVYWATHASEGDELPDQAKIAVHNGRLKTLYRQLERTFGIRAIVYPERLLTADRKHKWGLAPYHYVPEMYAHTLHELSDFAMRMAQPPSTGACG